MKKDEGPSWVVDGAWSGADAVGALGLLGALPMMLLGGLMDEEERKLEDVCKASDLEAQYVLRTVEHYETLLSVYEKCLSNQSTSIVVDKFTDFKRAIFETNVESMKQLLMVYKERHTQKEETWKTAQKVLLDYRNQREFKAQEKRRIQKERDEAIALRLSAKFPGRQLHSYDHEWAEEAVVYDRENQESRDGK